MNTFESKFLWDFDLDADILDCISDDHGNVLLKTFIFILFAYNPIIYCYLESELSDSSAGVCVKIAEKCIKRDRFEK